MKALLIILTVVEVALLVTVLAAYLLLIARTLRTVARTLGLVTFGVRAIEKQTEPLGNVLRDVNSTLEEVTRALGLPPAQPRLEERTVEAVEHGGSQEISSSGS
jgi:hypothetical protein